MCVFLVFISVYQLGLYDYLPLLKPETQCPSVRPETRSPSTWPEGPSHQDLQASREEEKVRLQTTVRLQGLTVERIKMLLKEDLAWENCSSVEQLTARQDVVGSNSTCPLL